MNPRLKSFLGSINLKCPYFSPFIALCLVYLPLMWIINSQTYCKFLKINLLKFHALTLFIFQIHIKWNTMIISFGDYWWYYKMNVYFYEQNVRFGIVMGSLLLTLLPFNTEGRCQKWKDLRPISPFENTKNYSYFKVKLMVIKFPPILQITLLLLSFLQKINR